MRGIKGDITPPPRKRTRETLVHKHEDHGRHGAERSINGCGGSSNCISTGDENLHTFENFGSSDEVILGGGSS